MFIQGTEFHSNIQRDHAVQSAKMIQEMKFFRELADDVKLTIINAIGNHNKAKLQRLEDEQLTTYSCFSVALTSAIEISSVEQQHPTFFFSFLSVCLPIVKMPERRSAWRTCN